MDKRTTRTNRVSKILEIQLGKMAVSGRIQRDLKEYRVNHLLANFDLEDFGLPTLNRRDEVYYIIDGQHRIEALKRWLGDGWEIQRIPCKVYEGMSERDEADMFDRLNDTLRVGVFDKFKNRVTAGRETEVRIAEVVKSVGLVISRDSVPGAIGAVGTLVKVYTRSDGQTLAKSLRIIRDAFGDSGLEAAVIDGIGHLCQRYNGSLDEELTITRLSETRGGVKGLLGKAAVLKRQTGNSMPQCVAAATVDIINASRGGKKLPSWWKSGDQEERK